jgi:hypothetical protein
MINNHKTILFLFLNMYVSPREGGVRKHVREK